MNVQHLAVARPPCSRTERSLADAVASRFRAAGLAHALEPVRATTSPTWSPLAGSALRLGAAVLLAVDASVAALVVAAVAGIVALRPPLLAPLMRLLPGAGGSTVNAVARADAVERTTDPPLVVVAHLDTHPTAGAPLRRPHLAATRISALTVTAASVFEVITDEPTWTVIVSLIAIEAMATMFWLARGELGVPADRGMNDNGTGLAALVRTAELLGAERPVRQVWMVATAAATSDGSGMRTFLKAHPDAARSAWVIDIDALGAGELVASPARRSLPRSSTPQAVLRAVAGAAIDTGDVIDIRRRSRPHSDAAIAFGRGVPAVTITAGVPPPGTGDAGDDANAERAARIVERLARTTL